MNILLGSKICLDSTSVKDENGLCDCLGQVHELVRISFGKRVIERVIGLTKGMSLLRPLFDTETRKETSIASLNIVRSVYFVSSSSIVLRNN